MPIESFVPFGISDSVLPSPINLNRSLFSRTEHVVDPSATSEPAASSQVVPILVLPESSVLLKDYPWGSTVPDIMSPEGFLNYNIACLASIERNPAPRDSDESPESHPQSSPGAWLNDIIEGLTRRQANQLHVSTKFRSRELEQEYEALLASIGDDISLINSTFLYKSMLEAEMNAQNALLRRFRRIKNIFLSSKRRSEAKRSGQPSRGGSSSNEIKASLPRRYR